MAAFTAAAMLALTAANSATQYITQRRAAAGAEAQGNYEAGILEQNASLADQQRADALARGREAELQQRRGTRGMIGAQRAAIAASGVSVGSGSALDVQTDTAHLGELDALTLRNNAAREAWGFDVQAADLRAKAAMAAAGGRNTAQSLRNASYGTILTGVLSTYGMGKDAGWWGGSSGASARDVGNATRFGRRFAGSGY